MNFFLPDINNNYAGYLSLVELYGEINKCETKEELIINMPPNWISANMCSPFGAILKLASKKVRSIELKPINQKALEILNKNNFLREIGFRVKPINDIYNSTIKYRQFYPRDSYFFTKYVENDFMGHLPPMSEALNKKFKYSIYEIFANAFTHSETETIFVCGQEFFNRQTIDFSITDIGMGFYKNVTTLMDLNLTPVEAIEWAMQGNNTTKKGSIPGGIGLKSIKEFITYNKGKIQIASDCGYWELSNGMIKTRTFSTPFPGSVVNIEINTADPCTYNLQERFELDDIF